MRSKVAALGFAALVLGGTTTSASECVIPAGDGRVNLDCRGVPLGQVFRGLRAVAAIDTRLVDSAAQEVPVYVGLKDASLAHAAQAALEAAGISFVMSGSEASDIRIYASARPGSPATPARAAASSRAVSAADATDYAEPVDENAVAGMNAPPNGEEVSIVTTPTGAVGPQASPGTTQPNAATMEEVLGRNPTPGSREQPNQ